MLTRAMGGCLPVVLVLLALLPNASAQGTVALGSDYFQTVPGVGNTSGTWFNFGSGIGVVDFVGVPLTAGQLPPGYGSVGDIGNTDTIVQRQANVTLNGAPVTIQLMALSLGSEAPVLVGGNLYNVSLTLDNALGKSTGTISIMGNTTTGGTFTSSLSVFFDASFKPVAGGSAFNIPGEVTLTNNGASWSPTPTSGDVLVHGPVGDQIANCHDVSGSCLVDGGSLVDFFPSGPFMECDEVDGSGCHEVDPATPEIDPGSGMTALTLVFGMAAVVRGRRK